MKIGDFVRVNKGAFPGAEKVCGRVADFAPSIDCVIVDLGKNGFSHYDKRLGIETFISFLPIHRFWIVEENQ